MPGMPPQEVHGTALSFLSKFVYAPLHVNNKMGVVFAYLLPQRVIYWGWKKKKLDEATGQLPVLRTQVGADLLAITSVNS